MNSYAEGVAEMLREHKRVPTSETLLDYVKKQTEYALMFLPTDEVIEADEIHDETTGITYKER